MKNVEIRGPWDERETGDYLDSARGPVRLGYVSPAGGPRVVSLWWLAEGAKLWLATQQSAAVARAIAADGRVAFDVSPNATPYRGVRGHGQATLVPARGAEMLERLIVRFLGDADSDLARWLLSRSDRETAIAIEPRSITTWDYSSRMKGSS